MLYIYYSPYFTYMTDAPAHRQTQRTTLWRPCAGEMSNGLDPLLLLSCPFSEWFSCSKGNVMYWCTYTAADHWEPTCAKKKKISSRARNISEKDEHSHYLFQLLFAKISNVSIPDCHALLQTFTAVWMLKLCPHYMPAEHSTLCRSDTPPGDLDKQGKTNGTM